MIIIPMLLLGVYVGLDVPIDSFGITGQEIPYKSSVFLIGAFLCFLFHFFRSLKRWTSLYIVNKKNQFKWSVKIGSGRKKRTITYTTIEILFMLILSFAFYKLTPVSIAISLTLLISALDSFCFLIYGLNKFKIIVSSKAVFISDREVYSLYFKGLRKISIHQQSVYFDYIKGIQLHFPLDCFEEKDVSSFLNTINNLIDKDRVYFSKTQKYFKRN